METSSLINMKDAGIMRTLLLAISGSFTRRQQIYKVLLMVATALVTTPLCPRQQKASIHADLSPCVLPTHNKLPYVLISGVKMFNNLSFALT